MKQTILILIYQNIKLKVLVLIYNILKYKIVWNKLKHKIKILKYIKI
jgi:hypothetical protein